MGRGSPIPPMLRRKIVEQYQKGVSQRKIAKSLKLSSSTVHNIIQRFREPGTISVRKGQGRKTILDARDLRALRRHCITYRNATVMEITTWAQEYFQKTLSVNTIHRAIRRCRLKLYRSKKKPYLNMIQKHRRFLWAKAHLKWTVAKWKTVLWSDESKFEVLFGKLGRHVIRTKEDKDNPSCYQRSVQKPASLMVWGCMSACGMGSLHIWKGTINAESVPTFLESGPITSQSFRAALACLDSDTIGDVIEVGCELEEKERFWSELDEVMESIPTGERVVIGADFNGHVGEGNTGDEEVMGKFGVKERNLEGQMVVDFAKRMDMGVVNTYFQKREEHRVTYKSGDRRTQVDYILCRRGNLKEISDCKVVVGESVARQHRMVVCRMTLMVCKKKRSEIEKKTKWWKLKKEECCEEFRQKLRQALGGQVLLPDDWETTAEVIRETGRKVLGVSSGRRKEDKETWWWNEEVQDSIQRKRLAKKKWDMDRTEENRQEYKELQRRVKREVSKAKQKAYDELYTRLDTREGEKDLYRLARQRDRDGKDVQQKVDKIRKDEVRKALKTKVGRQSVLMTSRWRSGSVWERQQWNF
ncbi:hypothetical protein QTP70_012469 [Hemibagrus guttatus]|uniref:Paired domain-containing protein n=1 Tax=Hemibagrus guttatus TaxID=175788 RepID=A0AAE0QGE1_9TELE|nr:hypothetical protein QTP70_012469 [Hemibagrus guttatus]